MHGGHGVAGSAGRIRMGAAGSGASRHHAGDTVVRLHTGHACGVVHDQVTGLDHRRPRLRPGAGLRLRCCCVHASEITQAARDRPSGGGMSLAANRFSPHPEGLGEESGGTTLSAHRASVIAGPGGLSRSETKAPSRSSAVRLGSREYILHYIM